jgi:hypothetical protein
LPLSSFQGSPEAVPGASINAAAHSAVLKDIFIAFSLWYGRNANAY